MNKANSLETKPPFFSRRKFIIGALATPVVITGYHLTKHVPKLFSRELTFSGQILNNFSAALMGHVYLAITNSNDTQNIPRALEVMDRFLALTSKSDQHEFKLGLSLFEFSPYLLGYRKSFSHCDLNSQQKVLKSWSKSPKLLYPLFMALKELSYLAYYSMPENFKAIGYRGPIVNLEQHDPKFFQEYLKLQGNQSDLYS